MHEKKNVKPLFITIQISSMVVYLLLVPAVDFCVFGDSWINNPQIHKNQLQVRVDELNSDVHIVRPHPLLTSFTFFGADSVYGN